MQYQDSGASLNGGMGAQPRASNTFAGMQRQGYARPPRPPHNPADPYATDEEQLRRQAAGAPGAVAPAAPPPPPSYSSAPPPTAARSVISQNGGIDIANATNGLGGPTTPPAPPAAPPTAPAAPTAGTSAAAPGTAAPTATNAYAGYTSPQGGGFGGDYSSPEAALRTLESVTGVSRDKFGLPADATVDQIKQLVQLMGGIGNGNKDYTSSGLSSDNPFVRDTARSYTAGFGSQGLPAGFDWSAFANTQANGGNPTANAARSSTASPANGPSMSPGAANIPTVAGPAGTGATLPVAPHVPLPPNPGDGNGTDGGTGGGFNINDFLRNQLLNSPTGYDNKALQDEFSRLSGGIDDEFTQSDRKLKAEMAARGLSDSSIYGGRTRDLNVEKRDAKTSLASQLATKRADAMTTGQQSWYDRLNGAGQQAFNNDVTVEQMNQRQQDQYDALMRLLLGAGV